MEMFTQLDSMFVFSVSSFIGAILGFINIKNNYSDIDFIGVMIFTLTGAFALSLFVFLVILWVNTIIRFI